MSIAVNLPDGMIARLGFEPDYLMAALVALVLAGFIISHRMAMIVLVVAVCIGANLPLDMAERWGLDRDILVATLVAILFTQWLTREHLDG